MNAQENILLSKGFDEIKIGTHIDNVIHKIGEPTVVSSREQEIANWEVYGYEIEKMFVFQFPFDEVYLFENKNEFAIWKVYLKNKKIIYCNLSSYIFGKEIAQHIKTQKGIEFYISYDEALSHFKKKEILFFKNSIYQELLILKKGIRFIFDEEGLRNIIFFNPIKKKKKIKALLEQLEYYQKMK